MGGLTPSPSKAAPAARGLLRSSRIAGFTAGCRLLARSAGTADLACRIATGIALSLIAEAKPHQQARSRWLTSGLLVLFAFIASLRPAHAASSRPGFPTAESRIPSHERDT